MSHLLTLLLFPFIFMSVQVSAQINHPPFKNDLLRDDLKGTVKSKSEFSGTTLRRITIYNATGFVTSLSEYCLRGKLQTVCSYYKCVYDHKGNKIKMVDEFFISDYKYDDRNNLIEEIQRSARVNGKVTNHMEYRYNNAGKLLSQHQTRFQFNSEKIDFIHQVNSAYDSINKLICDTIIHKSAGKPNTELTNYYYDSDGNLLKKIESHTDGQIGQTRSYTYDKDKRLKDELIAYPTSSANKYFTHQVMVYDQSGNTVERINYNEDGTILYRDTDEFDQKKNRISTCHFKGFELTAKKTYLYNNLNLVTTEEDYFYGKLHSINKYLYDERGNLISFKSTDEHGKITIDLSYKFDYYD